MRDAADRAFGAAGHHHVGIAQRDQARRIADGVRAGRAGRDDGVVGALELVLDRDVAGGEIDQAARNEERADAARALFLQQQRRSRRCRGRPPMPEPISTPVRSCFSGVSATSSRHPSSACSAAAMA